VQPLESEVQPLESEVPPLESEVPPLESEVGTEAAGVRILVKKVSFHSQRRFHQSF
jgi:hypothetical protein